MKVGIITDCLSRHSGGLLDAVRGEAVALYDAGIKVGIFGIRDDKTEADLLRWSPLDPVVASSLGPTFFNFAPDLNSELRNYDPDLVEVHGLWKYTSVAALAWQRRSKRPRLVHPHGMLDPWALQNSGWKKKLAYAVYEKAHLQGASCIRALCESEARSIREMGILRPIAVIPNGIDLPDCPPSVSAPWEERIEAGRKVLLYLGRLHPKKNLMELVRAWKESSGAAKNEWLLAISGWDQGGYEEELKSFATELGVAWEDLRTPRNANSAPPSILFTGPQFHADKSAAYFYSDAFILPSLSEGLPMVVLEAWAYGKPVLMTDNCNLPVGFASNAAIRIESGATLMAEGLRQLLTMSISDRLDMGNRGRELVALQFSWEKIALATKRLYEWVLGYGAVPDFVIEEGKNPAP